MKMYDFLLLMNFIHEYRKKHNSIHSTKIIKQEYNNYMINVIILDKQKMDRPKSLKNGHQDMIIKACNYNCAFCSKSVWTI